MNGQNGSSRIYDEDESGLSHDKHLLCVGKSTRLRKDGLTMEVLERTCARDPSFGEHCMKMQASLHQPRFSSPNHDSSSADSCSATAEGPVGDQVYGVQEMEFDLPDTWFRSVSRACASNILKRSLSMPTASISQEH